METREGVDEEAVKRTCADLGIVLYREHSKDVLIERLAARLAELERVKQLLEDKVSAHETTIDNLRVQIGAKPVPRPFKKKHDADATPG